VRLQSAVPPTGLDHSRQIKVAGAGGVAAFGLLLFGVGFWEFRSRKVGAASDVVRGLGMNLVGTLPVLRGGGRGPVNSSASKRDQHWQSLVTESIDSVRTMILHLARADGLHVVMITSAVSGEGKTSVASQLAASLARAWRKTLLVDGDLRNPAVHKLFNVSAEPGLSEVLRGEATLQDVVHPTALSRLWVAPAGHWDAHAIQALAQDGVGQLFAQLKEQYDFVIIDSCPVLPVADSLLLAQHVDAVVFSVLKDVSRLPMVQAAREKLSALGVRTLGAVVIGGDPASLAYQYPNQ
jgi:capsular exopolysaccharide synthesis family protein